MNIENAKRLIALSPDGLRLLGTGVYRACHQSRYNIAAEAALADGSTDYTPQERRLIASFIEGDEESRDAWLRVRLTESERGELARLSEAAGLTMSEFVRRAVFAQEV